MYILLLNTVTSFCDFFLKSSVFVDIRYFHNTKLVTLGDRQLFQNMVNLVTFAFKNEHFLKASNLREIGNFRGNLIALPSGAK